MYACTYNFLTHSLISIIVIEMIVYAWKESEQKKINRLRFFSPLYNLKIFPLPSREKIQLNYPKNPISIIFYQIKKNCNLMKFWGELRKLFLCLPVPWIHFVLLTKEWNVIELWLPYFKMCQICTWGKVFDVSKITTCWDWRV